MAQATQGWGLTGLARPPAAERAVLRVLPRPSAASFPEEKDVGGHCSHQVGQRRLCAMQCLRLVWLLLFADRAVPPPGKGEVRGEGACPPLPVWRLARRWSGPQTWSPSRPTASWVCKPSSPAHPPEQVPAQSPSCSVAMATWQLRREEAG